MNIRELMDYIALCIDFESDDCVERIEANVIPDTNQMVVYYKDDEAGVDTAFVLTVEQRREK